MEASNTVPLPPELLLVVAGYAADAELNEKIALQGRAVFAQFPAELAAAFQAVTEVALNHLPTAAEVTKLQEVYPSTAASIFPPGVLEGMTRRSMFDDYPPLRLRLNDGSVRTIMAATLVADQLSGVLVEGIDWAKGRQAVMQKKTVDIAVDTIQSVQVLAPTFEAWAATQQKK